MGLGGNGLAADGGSEDGETGPYGRVVMSRASDKGEY